MVAKLNSYGGKFDNASHATHGATIVIRYTHAAALIQFLFFISD